MWNILPDVNFLLEPIRFESPLHWDWPFQKISYSVPIPIQNYKMWMSTISFWIEYLTYSFDVKNLLPEWEGGQNYCFHILLHENILLLQMLIPSALGRLFQGKSISVPLCIRNCVHSRCGISFRMWISSLSPMFESPSGTTIWRFRFCPLHKNYKMWIEYPISFWMNTCL